MFAYCGLVVEIFPPTQLLKFVHVCSPSNVNQSVGLGGPCACVYLTIDISNSKFLTSQEEKD